MSNTEQFVPYGTEQFVPYGTNKGGAQRVPHGRCAGAAHFGSASALPVLVTSYNSLFSFIAGACVYNYVFLACFVVFSARCGVMLFIFFDDVVFLIPTVGWNGRSDTRGG